MSPQKNQPETDLPHQLVPAEVAAVLMHAIHESSPQEEQIIEHLAANPDYTADIIRTELIFLRAFAVDMAISTALGNDWERNIVLDNLYVQWELAAGQERAAPLDDWHDSLAYYRQLVSTASPDAAGLGAQLGRAYAQRCQASTDAGEDLPLFGASIFQAVFTGIVDMLQTANIRWPCPEQN